MKTRHTIEVRRPYGFFLKVYEDIINNIKLSSVIAGLTTGFIGGFIGGIRKWI